MGHRGLVSAEVTFKPDVGLQSCYSTETSLYHGSEKSYSLRRNKHYLMTLRRSPLTS